MYRATQHLSTPVRGRYLHALSFSEKQVFPTKDSKLALWNLHVPFGATHSSCFKSIIMALCSCFFISLWEHCSIQINMRWTQTEKQRHWTVKYLKLFSVVKCHTANWEKSALYRPLCVRHPHRCPLQRGQWGLARVTAVSLQRCSSPASFLSTFFELCLPKSKETGQDRAGSRDPVRHVMQALCMPPQ